MNDTQNWVTFVQNLRKVCELKKMFKYKLRSTRSATFMRLTKSRKIVLKALLVPQGGTELKKAIDGNTDGMADTSRRPTICSSAKNLGFTNIDTSHQLELIF